MDNKISSRDFMLLVAFLVTSTIQVTGIAKDMKQDSWIAILLSLPLVVLLMLLYARMCVILPGKDIYGMARFSLGRVGGGVAGALFVIYVVHMAALVLCNIAGFIGLAALHHAAPALVMAALMIPALHIAKNGIHIIGKWAFLLFALFAVITLSNTLFALPIIDLRYLEPVLRTPLPKLAAKAASIVVYPFGEIVLVLAVAGGLPGNAKKYKLFVAGVLAGAVLLLWANIHTKAVLGSHFTEATLFAAFKATSVTKLGTFLQRLEAATGFMFVFYGILKLALCVTAASRGLATLLPERNRIDLTMPAGMVALALAPTLFANNHQMYEFVQVYIWWAIPFQILIPAAIWVVAEVRTRRQRRSAA